MVSEEPRPVTEAPTIPPRLARVVSDATIEELLGPFSTDEPGVKPSLVDPGQ